MADYYSWSFGDPDAKIEENRRFFKIHNIVPQSSKTTVDLGAGSGFQSIPLAEKGFKVTAIDFSQKLLEELIRHKNELNITTICDNMLNFNGHISTPLELIICMGDALTHLESFEQMELLFRKAYTGLENRGRFILTFRDLTARLEDLDRFFPVHSNKKTIFTCFIEYEDHYVRVHDLIYVREQEKWILKKSFYRKLRIPMDWVINRLTTIGFQSEISSIDKGLITVIARK